MKNPFNLLSLGFLLLCLSLWSCEKEEPSFTEISGQVYEYGTNKPIPFAKVRFEWWDPAVYGESRHFVDSTTADENGRYYLSGDVPEDEEYYVIAKAPNYFKTEGSEPMKPNVKRGVNQSVNLGLTPHAWVKMNITRTGTHANLEIGRLPGSSRGYQIMTDTSIISSPVFGNRELELILFKYKHHTVKTEIVKVTTLGHDTVEVDLSF